MLSLRLVRLAHCQAEDALALALECRRQAEERLRYAITVQGARQ